MNDRGTNEERNDQISSREKEKLKKKIAKEMNEKERKYVKKRAG